MSYIPKAHTDRFALSGFLVQRLTNYWFGFNGLNTQMG
ncbi:MAG: hypothetical protein H6Q20_58 [Bacteroidetes bacterium]|jgi:hypothetical protein|nr:hypothetical protein [Bacteroidota bacterium]